MALGWPKPTEWTPRGAYAYDVAWITILILLALGYAIQPALTWLPHWNFSFQNVAPLWVPWAGALGGTTISLVGVAKHAVDWDAPKYGYWHLSRPFLGAVGGTVAVLIVVLVLRSVDPPAADSRYTAGGTAILAVIAFVVGYREDTFRALIKKVVDVILEPGDRSPTSPVKLVPSVIDFGNVVVAQSKVLTAQLYNGGVDTIHIAGTAVTLDPQNGAVAIAALADTELSPDSSMPIQLTWTPPVAGTLDTTLVVATESRRVTARIKGIAQ